MKRRLTSRSSLERCAILLASILFLVCSSSQAQQDQQAAEAQSQSQQPHPLHAGKSFAELASSFAATLKLSGVTRIYIEDFRAPDGNVTPFGGWLASQLASAPGNPWSPIEIVGRDTVARKLKLPENPETIQLNAEGAQKLSASLKADIVIGSFAPAENGIGITLKFSRPNTWAFLNEKVAMTEEIRSHLPAAIESLAPADGIYTAEQGGVPNPKCDVCPSPQYDAESVRRAVQGSVTLLLVISPAGKVLSVSVEKKLDSVLDRLALDAAKNWTFKPPVDIDGKPITVRAPTDVRFRLWK
jgi:TonB family protein